MQESIYDDNYESVNQQPIIVSSLTTDNHFFSDQADKDAWLIAKIKDFQKQVRAHDLDNLEINLRFMDVLGAIFIGGEPSLFHAFIDVELLSDVMVYMRSDWTSSYQFWSNYIYWVADGKHADKKVVHLRDLRKVNDNLLTQLNHYDLIE